jgi:tetratricopeptide (TPR) repeat protein
LLTTALLIAWLIAAARVTGIYPRRLPFRRGNGEPRPRRDWSGDRVALVALALIAIVFGLQSAIDWTWFVPGPTAMALVAAGFVAGRAPIGSDPDPAIEPGPPAPARLLAGSAILLISVVLAWAIWQPEASDRDTTEAIRLAEQGDFQGALAKTTDAADANPLNPDPLLTRAAIETDAGLEDAAQATLEQAVLKFPGDPQTWLRLAAFQLGTLDRPEQAASTLRGALFLDPLSQQNRTFYLAARARAREK